MSASQPGARERFLSRLGASVADGTFGKLTLGKHRGADATLQNLHLRPVELKSGPRLSCLWRHDRRDITRNLTAGEGLALVDRLLGTDFLDAHLFTAADTLQFSTLEDGRARLRTLAPQERPAAVSHDRTRERSIPDTSPWLHALGVTNPEGRPREGQAHKLRQIHKFAELVVGLAAEAGFEPRMPRIATDAASEMEVVDLGSGKGYLTFALAAVLGERARVRGVEVRPELVNLCNKIAADHGFSPRLSFEAGTIAETPLGNPDIVVALHACDTATDDALARAIASGTRLIIAAPCCQKELRPQLAAPPVLAEPLRHGIFQERQAEFVTDALRAALLEWAGYRTKVFEFISTEHTAKNLMIAAIKARPPGTPTDARAQAIRDLAGFYGIRTQSLARQLDLKLTP